MLIPAHRLPELTAAVTKINKRAAKHGASAFTLSFGATSKTRVELQDGRRMTITFVDCDLSGPDFKMAGYSFIGRIEHANDADGKPSNLVLAAPGATIPVEYRNCAPDCDHCRVARHRTDTFILRNDASGDYVQIGRNCLADYIGHSAESIIALFTALRLVTNEMNDESFGWRGTGFARGGDPLDILAYTAASVERDGWCSKKDAEGRPDRYATARAVVDSMLDSQHVAALGGHVLRPTDAHFAEAEKALAWLRTGLAAKPSKSDFEYNLTAIMAREFVESKLFGFACYGWQAYQRHMERERANAAARAAGGASRHVGAIGERADFTVSVLGLYPTQGNFGPTTVCRLRDQAGNNLVWFATGRADLTVGETVTVKATVKKHGYSRLNGAAETTLLRCAIVARVAPALKAAA